VKALHVVTLHTPDNAFGGPMTVAANLCAELRRRGDQAVLLTMGRGFGRSQPGTVQGVPAVVAPGYRLAPQLGMSGIVSPGALSRAVRLVRQADVVHVHLARDLLTAPVAALALQAGTPLVLQTHGMVDPSDKLLAGVLDSLLVRRVLHGAGALLYLTELERTQLLQVLGVPAGQPAPDSLRRLVNGVAPADRRPAPAGPPLISYIARFQERKRPEDLVRAFAEVLRSRPDARLVLAGPDEGRLAATLDLVSSLSLDHAVEYVGALDHDGVLGLLRRSSAYVLPAVDEPFPMSVLEALSVGVPTVVTTSNGLAADIGRAGAGRVVAGADELAGAVLQLLDPAANDAASRAAHELSSRSFSLSAVTDTLQDVYGRVVPIG
jgi:glycosyltransferase involved in cell wall biosynthesis